MGVFCGKQTNLGARDGLWRWQVALGVVCPGWRESIRGKIIASFCRFLTKTMLYYKNTGRFLGRPASNCRENGAFTMAIELEKDNPLEMDIGKYLSNMHKQIRMNNEFSNLGTLKEELLVYYSGKEHAPAALLERYRRLNFWRKLPGNTHLALMIGAVVTVLRHLIFPTGAADWIAVGVALAVGALLLWDRPWMRLWGNRPYLWEFEVAIIRSKLLEEHGFHTSPVVEGHWEGEGLIYREAAEEK